VSDRAANVIAAGFALAALVVLLALLAAWFDVV
jgi:hypothetical protein